MPRQPNYPSSDEVVGISNLLFNTLINLRALGSILAVDMHIPTQPPSPSLSTSIASIELPCCRCLCICLHLPWLFLFLSLSHRGTKRIFRQAVGWSPGDSLLEPIRPVSCVGNQVFAADTADVKQAAGLSLSLSSCFVLFARTATGCRTRVCFFEVMRLSF